MNPQHEYITKRFGENCRIRYNKAHKYKKKPMTIKEHSNSSTQAVFGRLIQEDELILDIGDEVLNKYEFKKKTIRLEEAKKIYPEILIEVKKIIKFLDQQSIPYWTGFQGRGFHLHIFFRGEGILKTQPALRYFKQAIIKWMIDNTGADLCLDVNNKAEFMIRAFGSQDNKKCFFVAKKCYLKTITAEFPLKQLQEEKVKLPGEIKYWTITNILIKQFKETRKAKRNNEYWSGSKELKISNEDLMNTASFISVCERLINYEPLVYDNASLWWSWNKEELKYEIIDEVDILNKISKILHWNGIINSGIRNQFLTALKMVARRNKPKEMPITWIQFKDKIINYETEEEITPSPEYFLTNPIPWKLGDSEEMPTIDELFTSWVDESHTEVLYQLISYCLLKDYPLQRIFILYGSGGNGKGQFLGIAKKFLGKENCTSTELHSIGKNRFESAKLMNKLACFIAETNVTILQYTSTLKKLVGGDLVGGEFKNKPLFDFINHAKLIMASNSIPITFDKTYGFYRRMNIIEFSNRFKDGNDIIKKIPEVEYENLGRKCLKILKGLLKNGFINDGEVEERKEKYERLSNPMIVFIEEGYNKELNNYVIKTEFVERLKKFLDKNGFRMLNNKDITSALNMLGYETRQKKINGYPIQVIYGLGEKVKGVKGVKDAPIYPSHREHQVETPFTGLTPFTSQEDVKIDTFLDSGGELE